MDTEPAGWRVFGRDGSAAASDWHADRADPTTTRPAPIGSGLELRAVLIVSVVAVAVGICALLAALYMDVPSGGIELGSDGGHRAGASPSVVPLGIVLSRDAGAMATGGAEPVTAVLVDVEGAVARPGLHRLAAGARVGDAIDAAGGFGGGVDLPAVAATLNLAAAIADGTKVVVPRIGDAQVPLAGPTGPGASFAPGGAALIDLNHADQAALESLPGIGPVTAGKILAARAQAPFASVDEVASRGAVSASTLEKIRALVTVTP